MMKLKDMAGADAERIMAGERVMMKRWLLKHGVLESWGRTYRQDTEAIAPEVRKHGGDPEALRLKGRKMMVEAICKERGL